MSDAGRVKSLCRMVEFPIGSGRMRRVEDKFLSFGNRRKYLCVTLFKGGIRKVIGVHRLVAEAFIGPRPNPKTHTCHNDGNTLNNKLENLRYDSQEGNFSDKVSHGTHAIGEKNPSAKLSDLQVLDIIAIGRSRTQKEIAKIYGVHQCTISDILLGNRRLAPENIHG